MAGTRIFLRLALCASTFVVGVASAADVARASGRTIVREDKLEFARHRLLETALKQATEMSGYWDPGQRDCAGLVRFVYRQAVSGPAEMWRDRANQLKSFVSAAELVPYNFTKIGDTVDPQKMETGDLLVYFRPNKKPEDTWHVMILLRPPTDVRQEWLAVYHNGVVGPGGQVRIVTLKDLSSTVHSEWRPTGENVSFKGVYRWNQWVK